MGHESRAGFKDGKDGDEDVQLDVWCFNERTIEKTPCCRGNWGCDKKLQTEVAWTSWKERKNDRMMPIIKI